MRYRIYSHDANGWLDLAPDDGDYDRKPVVHVFRDDELEQLAEQLIRAAYTDPWTDVDAVVDILRNHGT